MGQAWKAVRVFISSTFRDMHAERDHLVRTIFPELKERCRKRRVHLIDVDLRWGVTEKDAHDGNALDICLDEIDTCRPYFVGLLGHRYGWVPPGHQHSITAQEIYHGVLHGNLPKQVVDLRRIIEDKLEGQTLSDEQKNCLARCYRWDADRRKYLLREDVSPQEVEIIRSVFERYSVYQKDRSFFFFRKESLTCALAGANIDDFFEQTKEDQDKLAVLKKEILDAALPHYEYDDIKACGQLVLDILWKRIEAEGEQPAKEEKDWLKEEAEFHELFMNDRTRRFVGRRDLLDRMHAFCVKDNDPSLLVVTGEPGCGKSALMSRLTEEVLHRHPDWLIIPHFVGASSASTGLRQTLRRLCTHLNRAIGATEDAPEDIKELLKAFPELLAKAAEQRKLLIILDAVNQFEKSDNAHSMRWLPQQLPKNVRFVISTLPGEAHDALLARRIKPQEETVKGLAAQEIEELVRKYLQEIRHEFPNRQVEEAFFEKVKHGNPLYILVALEELRVFGQFKELPQRVKELPDNVPALFDQVLARIESDFNPALVRDCMIYIACGRNGMTAEELQTLLKAHAPRLDPQVEPDKLPDMLWSRLYRAFSAYLFERAGVIDFFHSQLKEAVGKRYLEEEANRDATHKTIADYFEKRWSKPYLRALDELPHQRIKAKDWDGVERILCDLRFIEAKCVTTTVFDPLRDFINALSEMPYDCPERSAVAALHRAIDAESHILIEDSSLLVQQLYNLLVWEWDETTSLGRRVREMARSYPRTWLKRLNPPLRTADRALLRTLRTPGHICLAFSPDGKMLASGSAYTMNLWDVQTGQLLRALVGAIPRGEETNVMESSVAFSPDGKKLATGSGDTAVRLWDTQTGELLWEKGQRYRVFSVVFSPDGKTVASGENRFADGDVRLWDVQTGELQRILEGHPGPVGWLVFSADGNTIMSRSWTDSRSTVELEIWDVKTGTLERTLTQLHGAPGFGPAPNSMQLSPDGKIVVSVADNSTVKLWDARTGEFQRELAGHHSGPTSVAFSPDGRTVATVSGFLDSNSTVRLWDARTGELQRELAGHHSGPTSVAFSPDGRTVATGDSQQVKLWDLDAAGVQGPLSEKGTLVTSAAFSPDGKILATGGNGDKVNLWDSQTRELKRTLHDGHMTSINSIVFSADGKTMASGSEDGSSSSEDMTVRLWDVQTGELQQRRGGGVAKWGRTLVALSPDGKMVVSDHALWDARTGDLRGTLYADKAVAFSPDGKTVACGSYPLSGAPVILRDAQTGECRRPLSDCPVCESLAFSPDGKMLAGGRRTGVWLWDVESGKLLRTLETPRFLSRDPTTGSVAFSPDGKMVAMWNSDETVRLWDVRTGELLAWMPRADAVLAIWFDPVLPQLRVAEARQASIWVDILRLENAVPNPFCH